MAKILKTIGDGVLIVLGIKLLEQILRNNRKKKPCIDPDIIVDRSNAKFIPNQLIVWKKEGVTAAEFDRWKSDNQQKYSGLVVKKLCESCDSTLELWEGDNVATFISERVAGSGGSGPIAPPSGGGDAVACFSYNLIIDLPEQLGCVPERDAKQRPYDRPQTDGDSVIVAVFDTGLMPEMKSAYTDGVQSLCMPGGERGWNFFNRTDVTDDDYPSRHGSAVTQFIIDQETRYRKRKTNILPVKIHNSHGKSDLFSILCGFAYAANSGATIINASFGFYATKGSGAPAILEQFVKKHLTANNILLVAAAGNLNSDETAGGPVGDDVRNLDYNPFFPASLSKTLENVVAVTTVSKEEKEVCPTQNFSNRVVDVGVNCDKIMPGDFRFESPLHFSNFIVGSSYATPIITGKIAQHHKELMDAMPLVSGKKKIVKILLLQEMKRLGIINSDPEFTTYLKDGNWADK
jgi:hypothetical protein